VDNARDFEGLQRGTHVCSIFRTISEEMATIIPYMLAGLKRGEQCVSVVNQDIVDQMVRALGDLGIDVKECQSWGQFIFLDPVVTYVSQGCFSPEQTIESLAKIEKDALSRGFTGLRVTGEASWSLSKLPGTERLIEYESKVNRFLPASKTLALCLYNETLYANDVLFDVIRTHPTVSIYNMLRDNPYYFPPEEFFALEQEKNPDEAYTRTRDALICAR
jgi:two-component system, sensor histidine kinase PdtaS